MDKEEAKRLNKLLDRARSLVEVELYATIFPVTKGAFAKAFRAARDTMTRQKNVGAGVGTADQFGWVVPNRAEMEALLDDELSEQILRQLRPGVTIVSGAYADEVFELSLGFDVRNPLAEGTLRSLGNTSTNISDAVWGQITDRLQVSWDQGLSVDNTVKDLRAHVNHISERDATRIARTETNAVNNAASVETAKATGATYKQWVSTNDRRTRPSHFDVTDVVVDGVESHVDGVAGRVASIDAPFMVGGNPAQYPGDPQLPASQRANCRCTVVYVTSPEGAEADGLKLGKSALAPDRTENEN